MARRPEPVQDLNWSRERALELGGAIVDLWAELVERLPELPVNRELEPERIREAVALDVPEEPLARSSCGAPARAHLRAVDVPRPPRLHGLRVGLRHGAWSPAALLAAGLNQNSGGWRLSPGATEIELHLMRWLASRFGLPFAAGGQLVAEGRPPTSWA